MLFEDNKHQATPVTVAMVRASVRARNLANNARGYPFWERKPLPPCEVCGNADCVDQHHDDYLKPLDVRYLCRSCHKRWHNEHGPGLNRDVMLPALPKGSKSIARAQDAAMKAFAANAAFWRGKGAQ